MHTSQLNCTVELNEQRRSPAWQRFDGGWFAGCIFHNDQLLDAEALAQQLAGISTTAALLDWLSVCNGSFAIVRQSPAQCWAVVDAARSIPLFWHVGDSCIRISDHIAHKEQTLNRWGEVGALAQSEFVPGHYTVYHHWQQLQAGEVLAVHGGKAELYTWFSHLRLPDATATTDALATQLYQAIESAVDRLIDQAQGRTIAIPLSGGYDSRLLLAALYQRRYPALQAFTYGTKGSKEETVARKCAERLGVSWRFVPYTPALLDQFGQERWLSYIHYACNGASLPQDQDYFALAALHDQSLLPEDSIICPGYCADFQAGSYLPPLHLRHGPFKLQRLRSHFYHKFVRHPDETMRQLWAPNLPSKPVPDVAALVSVLEDWALREYVTKYVVNGVRAYEFFGYGWALPLFDVEFLRFWQSVPIPHREGMQLYRHVLETQYFIPLGIHFPEYDHPRTSRPITDQWLPLNLKRALKNILPPTTPLKDINGLDYLRQRIAEELPAQPPSQMASINELLGIWLHEQVLR